MNPRFMKNVALIAACALAINAATSVAVAQTVTVTISADDIDVDWQTATIADLPGPDGEVSFSEAIIAANHTPGHQTIGFAIPQDDWVLQFVYPGRAVLTSTTGYFWRVFDEVTIDGTTQTAFTGDTNPDGWEVAIDGLTFYLNADNCTLIGFDSSSVAATASNALIQGNTGDMNITLFDGSGSLVQGNTGGTIKVDRSSNNVVVGNTVWRVRVLGSVGGGQPATNNRIGGPDPEDRNYITGYGSYNSEGMPNGTTVQLFDTVDTLIENNSIGTTPDGMSSGNDASTIGIGFEGENHGTIIRNNRIAGILGIGTWPHHVGQFFGWAIVFQQTASNISIVGNTIGLNANGEPLLGSVTGIDVGSFNFNAMDDIQIGGLAPGEGNTIAGHMFNGITIGRSVPGVRISGNSIYGSDALGIDLVPSSFGFGVTANDPLDADTGGNGLQNFPEIDSATREGTSLRVIGSLHSSPLSDFSLEIFASPDCDASGFGEGEVFLGSTTVTTDAAGDADFNVVLDEEVAAGWVVTSTATLEPVGATSEFAACTTVVDGTILGDLDGDGDVDQADLGILLSCYGVSDCGDIDGDGDTDQADLGELLGNYGS